MQQNGLYQFLPHFLLLPPPAIVSIKSLCVSAFTIGLSERALASSKWPQPENPADHR
jgi:hypothetical protein